jgi:hypothetical protein
MHRLLLGLLAFAFAVLAWNTAYGFALVSTAEADRLRGALLPFAFAWFATQRRYVPAALSIFLIVAFYPVLLNKTVAFAGIWLPFLFSLFEARRAAVLSLLLLPLLAGLIVVWLTELGLPKHIYVLVYGGVNYRMLAFPAWALERYFDFFAHHV